MQNLNKLEEKKQCADHEVDARPEHTDWRYGLAY